VLQATDEEKTLSLTVAVDPAEVGGLLEKEWLLTNQRGSYASGTVIGCNTRRYHGLLVAALQPPVRRIVTLANLMETVRVGGQTFDLANFEFSDRLHPQGFRFLKQFRRDAGVHFTYELGPVTVEKSVYLAHDRDLVLVSYEFDGTAETVQFTLAPLLALRDFHALQSASASLNMQQERGVVTIATLDPNGPAVHLHCPEAEFRRGPDWWYAMRYRQEGRRGQGDCEDVWACGAYAAQVSCPGRVVLLAYATAAMERAGPLDIQPDELVEGLRRRNRELVEQAQAGDETDRVLVLAADQFVARRRTAETGTSATILAGYHWFADWGRDAFVALPGLLLATRRFDEAREVLRTFAEAMGEGMVPNCFDDYGGPPHYNSVDASLWFIRAAHQYVQATGDQATYQRLLYPCLEKILAAYLQGTQFDIRADADGLLRAGNAETQLTWMDAKCNGVTFTPRHGKAVEVNALWINGLRLAAETAPDAAERQRYAAAAGRAAASFARLFWNPTDRCLYDCILPDGTPDAAIRPNQILAVSLSAAPLSAEQQASVVAVVEEQLLTPYGLRSLSPKDHRYRGYYHGDQFQRDSAYHQGTVWPWLMGPFAEAYLKVHAAEGRAARQRVAELIRPLLEHLTRDGCLGSVSEIFDGNAPHYAKGCIAQAWSVAELLRVKKLLADQPP